MGGIRKPKSFKFNCIICGQPFVAHRKSALYCSPACNTRACKIRKMAQMTPEELERLEEKRQRRQAEKEAKKKPKEDNILKVLRENNWNYAEYQKKQSIEMFARVKL